MAERSWRQWFDILLWGLLVTLERLFTENKLLKLISLGIALLMWFTISTQQERDRTLENIELVVVNRRADTVVTSVPVKVVDLRVRGPSSVVIDLDQSDIKVVVDVTGLDPDRHVIWLGADQVTTPAGVEVLRIDPPSIPVMIETQMSRQVPVKPNIQSDRLPPDRVVLDARVSPTTVQVSGPSSKISQLAQILTEPIDPSTVRSGETVTIALAPPATSLTVTPSTAAVTLFTDGIEERRFTELAPIWLPSHRSHSKQTVSVTLRGPHTLLDKIEPKDIIVKLDITKLPQTEEEVTPTIELSEPYQNAVTITSVEPEKVQIRSR